MFQLNLPSISASTKKELGKVWIFDIIRKKYVILTPEEWVRQHFVHHLIHNYHYPRSLFRIEGSLSYNSLQKRADILIRDREGQPWMLIECKSPGIKLSQNAFNQIAVYNMTINAKYLAVTNGMVHYCWRAPKQNEKVSFLSEFPEFN